VNRAAEHRQDRQWLADKWAGGQLLTVDDQGRAAIDENDAVPRLLFSRPDGPLPADALLLGVAGDVAYFAVEGQPPRRLGSRLLTLREIGAFLGDRDAHLFVTAVALTNWHRTHTHCPRCGAPTRVESAGFSRRCPADGSEHFPRTDPAVIMLVSDGTSRCVLARQPVWPAGMYSVLAGFVEPGESLEQAVRREVREEVGLDVRDVRYAGSQPWPFPSSLMLAFTAVAEPGDLQLGDGELEGAGWFDRDAIRAGDVSLPGPASIARRLIDDWFGLTPPGGR
jgi:NAD+ diphosphatase